MPDNKQGPSPMPHTFRGIALDLVPLLVGGALAQMLFPAGGPGWWISVLFLLSGSWLSLGIAATLGSNALGENRGALQRLLFATEAREPRPVVLYGLLFLGPVLAGLLAAALIGASTELPLAAGLPVYTGAGLGWGLALALLSHLGWR